MKKLATGTLLTLFLLAVMVTPAFAGQDTYPYLTFEDSADFTVVKLIGNNESITAMGLDSSFQKQTISDPENIQWTTSNSSVALFYDKENDQQVSTITGATVQVDLEAQGEATITASYTCADSSVITCPCNVVVERTSNPVDEVTGIDVTIVGDTSGSQINIDRTGDLNDVDVPWFPLTEIWVQTPPYDDDDVLKKDPTALHALLYTLELEKDSDNCVYGDANWDWDWVSSNVTLQSEGSYVYQIDVDQSGWPTGWKFRVNSQEEPDAASSIAKITNNDLVEWAFIEDWN